ncbi:DUF2254 domain-containing protein [Nocardioides sp. GY 10113]|uniref:DUF2254 domain-containing protein n=1 Tax=Nocardioides sp. GY 10113 TaxID=2569761 RepID=UPI0010A8DC07|nr:DUF2254 domain-containing protein [Nocardioides sp. GY 10113]TIC81336.1 DUF2254 domain-containing protein [Nocardioides sp. GY 10113]
MKTWLATTRDAVQARLWPVPTVAVVAAVLLGLWLPEVDAALDPHLGGPFEGWLFGGDGEAALSLLGVIASSLVSVTALTFSLTVVALQLASSQFSPRLLRTFVRDQFVQATLAIFLGTFTYALTVMRAVRIGNGDPATVPQLSVSVAFVLALTSVLALVLFLAHLVRELRVETMLAEVHRDASATLRAVLPERDPDAAPLPPFAAPLGEVRPLLVRDGGFLTRVDRGGLLKVAVEEDAQVALDVHPGSFLVVGTPLGRVWPARGGTFDDEDAARIADRVAGCLHTGPERTAAQDVAYGLRQLADVANKALSPGINDPTTAVHALGHVSALLCELTDRELGPAVLRDDQDRARVALLQPDLAGYVELGIEQPRRYGASDPQLLEAIGQVLLSLSHRAAPEDRPVVHDQLRRLRATAAAQDFDPEERHRLDELTRVVEQNLTEPA